MFLAIRPIWKIESDAANMEQRRGTWFNVTAVRLLIEQNQLVVRAW
jgi:hypothetical protein